MTVPAASGVLPVRAKSGGLAWHPATRLVLPLLPVAFTAGALLQRERVGARELALAALVVGPWLLQAAKGRLPVPGYRLAFSAVVLAGVLGLLTRPVTVDLISFIPIFLLVEVGVDAPRWQSTIVFVAAEAVQVGVEMWGPYTQSLPWLVALCLAWAAGLGLRALLTTMVDLRAAQSRLAERAAAEERQRIAREIHDVVAHSLSVTLLHLTGARHALEAGGDAGEALDALREAERIGRQSLADVRRTVGLLGPEPGGSAQPLPGVDDIPSLVETVRSAGASVRCDVRGDPQRLPPAMGLALYRIAQESLTNAVRHAAGSPIHLLLEIAEQDVRLFVRNDGWAASASNGSGRGLTSMAQRAQQVGGTFFAGPVDTGWLVEVRARLDAT